MKTTPTTKTPTIPKIGRRSVLLSLLTPPVRSRTPVVKEVNEVNEVNEVHENTNVHRFETANNRFAAVVVYDESPDGHCVVMNQAIRWRSFRTTRQEDDDFETKLNREVFLLDGTFT